MFWKQILNEILYAPGCKNYFPYNLTALMLYHWYPNLILSSTIVEKYWLFKLFWLIGVGHVAQFWIIRYKQKLPEECFAQFFFSSPGKKKSMVCFIAFLLTDFNSKEMQLHAQGEQYVSIYLMLLNTQLSPKEIILFHIPTNKVWE